MSPLYLYQGKLLHKNGKLATDEKCCCEECCIKENFSIEGIPGQVGDCQAVAYGEKTINRPPCAGEGVVLVEITGGVDDELLVDGIITQPNQFPFNGCNGAHEVNYAFILNNNSFTIAAGDNHGGSARYSLRICFKKQ